ncbi:NifB/NifX family molybdenum-iron cluster-binding protein [Candidatus Omnitrophota bacterium]
MMRVAIVTHDGFVYPHELCALCAFTIITYCRDDDSLEKKIVLQKEAFQDDMLAFLVNSEVDIVVAGFLTKHQKLFFHDNGIRVITGITGTIEDVIQWIIQENIESSQEILLTQQV